MTFTSHCKDCPFYKAFDPAVKSTSGRYGSSGECRRNAPYGQGDLFPKVSETDWCGEHPNNSIPSELLVMEPEDRKKCELTRVGAYTRRHQF